MGERVTAPDVADEQVEAALLAVDPLDEAADLRGVGVVGLDGDGAAAGSAEFDGDAASGTPGGARDLTDPELRLHAVAHSRALRDGIAALAADAVRAAEELGAEFDRFLAEQHRGDNPDS
jgi:hypothetical protein